MELPGLNKSGSSWEHQDNQAEYTLLGFRYHQSPLNSSNIAWILSNGKLELWDKMRNGEMFRNGGHDDGQ